MTPEGQTVLVANETYWEGKPKLDKVTFTAIPDSEARNQARCLAASSTTIRLLSIRFPSTRTIPISRAGLSGGRMVRPGVPGRYAPFTDPRIRKAMRIPVDRAEMVKLMVGEGNGVVGCDQPVKANDPFRAELDCPPDPEGAKKLLAEAGYPMASTSKCIPPISSPAWCSSPKSISSKWQGRNPREIDARAVDGYWDDSG